MTIDNITLISAPVITRNSFDEEIIEPPEEGNNNTNNTAAIVGSLVGGLIAAVILIILIVQYRRKNQVRIDIEDNGVDEHQDHEILKDEIKINKEEHSRMRILD
jgi:hypothetical protein